MTGYRKISLNVTFYNSYIYNQNEERELPIYSTAVTICGSHLELPENNWKYLKISVIFCCCHNKLCNSMCFNVTLRLIKTDFPKSGHNYACSLPIIPESFQNYSCKIGHLLFLKLCRHIRRRPKVHVCRKSSKIDLIL